MRRTLAGFALLLSACTAPEPWEAPLDREHPLAGRIFDAGDGRFVERTELIARLGAARFVVFGEKHDNADHQRLAAASIGVIGPKAVGFEMLASDRQGALDKARTDAPDFGKPFAPYRRIADAALAARARLVALNAPNALTRNAREGGVAALDPAFANRLGLARALDPAAHAAIAQEMRASHCNVLPESAIAGMVLVQRLWDAHMADRALAAAESGGPIVLIVGAGHARKDRGIPAALAARGADARVLSVAFVEVAPERALPADYASRFDAPRLPFDFVWFTPRATDADPCAAFRR